MSVLHVYAQDIKRLHLQLKKDYLEKGRFLGSSIPMVKQEGILPLLNGEISDNYSYAKIFIQLDSVKKRYSFIELIGGSTKMGALFIIADANFNHKFTDDSIYMVNLDTPVVKLSAYVRVWPEIIIPAVTIYTDEGPVTKPQSFHIILLPSPGPLHFKTREEVLANKKPFLLGVFPATYLTDTFTIGGSLYEMNIELKPFGSSFYKEFWEAKNISGHQVSVYKKNPVKDSLLFRHFIAAIQQRMEKGEGFLIGKQEIHFTDISLKNDWIEYRITDSVNPGLPGKGKFFGNITGFSVGDRKMKTICPVAKKYTLLFFSGSWCVPCKEVQPAFKELFEKYNAQTTFIKIAVEKNLDDAVKYYKKEKPKWEFFYENLGVKKPADLGKQFQIISFPHFVLIDREGKVIFKGDSGESIPAIEIILNKNKNGYGLPEVE